MFGKVAVTLAKRISSYVSFEAASDSAVNSPFQKASLSWLAVEFLSIHNYLAAGKHYVRHAFYPDAFKHRIIHAHVVGLGADGVLAVGVEDDEIGITAYGDGAFARVEAE